MEIHRALATRLKLEKCVANPTLIVLLGLPFAIIAVIAAIKGLVTGLYMELFQSISLYTAMVALCSFQTHVVMTWTLIALNLIVVGVRSAVWCLEDLPRDNYSIATIIAETVMIYTFTYVIFVTGIHPRG